LHRGLTATSTRAILDTNRPARSNPQFAGCKTPQKKRHAYTISPFSENTYDIKRRGGKKNGHDDLGGGRDFISTSRSASPTPTGNTALRSRIYRIWKFSSHPPPMTPNAPPPAHDVLYKKFSPNSVLQLCFFFERLQNLPDKALLRAKYFGQNKTSVGNRGRSGFAEWPRQSSVPEDFQVRPGRAARSGKKKKRRSLEGGRARRPTVRGPVSFGLLVRQGWCFIYIREKKG